MISKTKALSRLVATLLAWPLSASAYDPYHCLRELMPFTSHGTLRLKRKGVEQPFMAANYIVFPEVAGRAVSGFYVYAAGKAWYYDSVMTPAGKLPIRGLTVERGVLDLVAQPNGLETVSIPYLPGFAANENEKEGPAVLGSSVLPVVGAVFSRPARARAAYNSPADARESDLRSWMNRFGGARRPAADISLERTITRLAVATKSEGELWRPLRAELDLRRHWIQNNNLDERTFRDLTRAMRGPCDDQRK